MKMPAKPVAVLFALISLGAHAQSTVGELMAQGGKPLSKEDVLALMPARVEQTWPNRQGEEVLVLSEAGTITGTGYHYASRSTSPAEGTWKVEEDGKVCTPKTFTAWRNSTNLCWYGFQLGTQYFGGASLDASGRIAPIRALTKAPATVPPSQ